MSRCQCCGSKDECRCYPDPEYNDWWVSERTKLDDLLEAARRRTAVALWGWAGAERELDLAQPIFEEWVRLTNRIASLEAACRAKDEAISAARREISELIAECGCKPGGFCESFGCGNLRELDAALAAGEYEREGRE